MVGLGKLFSIFLQIGAFTLGGGYAMLAMVEQAIVEKHKFMDKDEFWDLIAVVQTLPGVFAINTALYVGYKLRGKSGALVASLGAALPSFVAILLIATFFAEIRDNSWVEKIFKGIRPCVVALILVPAIRLLVGEGIKWKIIWIPLLAGFLIWYLKVSPVIIILITAILSLIYGFFTYKKIEK